MYLVWSLLVYSCVQLRETREGWPLLTFETDKNWDSKSTNSWFIGRVVLVLGTRDFCPALAALVNPVQNIFFVYRILFQFICSPLPSQLGTQSCWVACLLECVSGSAYIDAVWFVFHPDG